MRWTELRLRGTYVIDVEPVYDVRGFFARTWCSQEAEQRGLGFSAAQCSVSFNRRKGTLRGMHYQAEPHAEMKLVRCTRGAIYDVILDLRPDSATFMRWEAVELSSENRATLFVPQGMAHGFQTLADDTEVSYQISEHYVPTSARAVRWNDPAFNILWPLPISIMSSRDREHPLFRR